MTLPSSRAFAILSVLAVAAVVVVANLPLLGAFERLLTMPELAASATDTGTHYLRMLHARDLYLPSGHHLGWEPYWYQGYVPFLLYPHLTYVLVALVSYVVPLEPARLFNAYTLLIYLALPLVAALPLRRRPGLAAALVFAAWFAVLNNLGVGLKAVFGVGLLTQQAGVLLFVALMHDVLLARRFDRAAIWLGLLPLVHMHAAIVAAMVWLLAGAIELLDAKERRQSFPRWFGSGVLALLIALPTLVALVQGFDQIGGSTAFGIQEDALGRLIAGRLIAPVATVAAVALAFVAALFFVPAEARRRQICWSVVALALFAISMERWTLGSSIVDRIFSFVLYRRTIPYAFVITAFLAILAWPRFPKALRLAVAVLSVAGLLQGWSWHHRASSRIGTVTASAKVPPEEHRDYVAALDWIAARSGSETSTLAANLPHPRTLALLTAVERAKLPMLGGHGIELTRIRNVRVVEKTEDLPCENISRFVRDFAVGYFLGFDRGQRRHLAACLDIPPSYRIGPWWVFATGESWAKASPLTTGFEHNETWTEMKWTLRGTRRPTQLRLPVANTAPWLADVDGEAVAIESSKDGLMRVTVPPGGTRLRLRYAGYPGEWASVAVAFAGLVAAILRARRHREPLATATAENAATVEAAQPI